MSVYKINFYYMHNDEHFEFCTNFLHLVNGTGAAKLKIGKLFDVWLGFYPQEDEALRKISLSVLTKKISDSDHARDLAFRGMAETNLAALNHFKPAVREAAERMQVVFHTYGNVVEKSVTEETSAIYNLLKDLMHNHEEDLETVGIKEWAEELQTRNTAVEKLQEERDSEHDGRTDLVLRQVRRQVDDAYRAITKRIDALMEVEGDAEDAPYAAFIHSLNTLIERYANAIAIRHGLSAAKKKEEEEQKPTKPAEPITN